MSIKSFVLVSLMTIARFAQAGETIIVCNDGDFTVEKHQGGFFQAVVWDQGVREYFASLEGQVTKGNEHGYPSNPYVPRRLPYMAMFDTINESPVFIVEDLKQHGDNFYSQQHGPTLKWWENGITLSIGNTHWNGSHSYISYEYANWYFESCEKI